MDAVGYSTLPTDEQALVFRQLQEFVSECSAVQEAATEGDVVRTPTGDGMAVTFFGNSSRPLRCATELADRIEKERTFSVRMGIHTGAVARQQDINGLTNISGDGINIAQRVMDFGDGGHILMSLEYARELQASGNPSANDCYDIGVVAAKHGKRVHLFNYHRPAVGTSDVPVKVRQDDQWERPKELRLGTAGRNAVVATLQILGWLFVAPSKWRTHVTQIDPRLTPNFTALDLTWPQIQRNRDLQQLLVQVFVVAPSLLTLLLWAILTPATPYVQTHAFFWIGMMWGMGVLATLLLGVGAGLVGFVILAFQAVVQGPAIGIFGNASAANVIALTAICVWAVVALAAVFPVKRRVSVVRELSAAVAASLVTVVAWSVLLLWAEKAPPLQHSLIMAAGAFVLINGVVGLRWKLWSRGFAFGQLLGVCVAACALSIPGVEVIDPAQPAMVMLAFGLLSGLLSAIVWATAFAVAEKLASERAAVAAGLLVTALLNTADALGSLWSLLPFAGIIGAYAFVRRAVAPV